MLPLGTAREEAHALAESHGAECWRCPMRASGRGPVFGTIKPGSKLHAIGEAPGDTEVEEGVCFTGATGRVLQDACEQGNLSMADVSVGNALLCQPWDTRTRKKIGLADYLDKLSRLHRRALNQWKSKAAVAAAASEAFDEPEPALVSPLDCCAPRLKRDINAAGARVLLAVGSAALRYVAQVEGLPFGKAKVVPGTPRVLNLKDQHGHPVDLPDGRVLMSSYHPAYAMHGSAAYARVIKETITAAAQVGHDGGYTWNEPEFIIEPSEAEALRVLALFRTQSRVTIDLETTGLKWWRRDCYITCIGLGAVVDGTEVVISIPIRRVPPIDAADDFVPEHYWPPASRRRIAHALTALFDDPRVELAGHNVIGFDSGKLLRAGLLHDRKRLFTDTMLAHHDTWANDLPHDLGFVTGRYLVVPNWKKDANSKYTEGAVGDRELAFYNCRDVLTTMRVVDPLVREMDVCETWPQYQVDQKVENICRNMTDLGIPVYEPMRQAMSRILNLRCGELLTELRMLANCELPPSVEAELLERKQPIPDVSKWGPPGGVRRRDWSDLNPRSVHQLRDLLFDYFELEPPLNTKQMPWDEEGDEDPSTSAMAIVRLMDRGLTRQQLLFFEKLLEYRAHEKLRGTYVDNLPVEFPDWGRWGHEYAAMNGKYGLIHPVWICGRVPTGRLASRGPNAMNITSRGRMNMYRMYYAPRGHVFVGADMDQLELRIYAEASGDELMWRSFQEGLDPHSMNAASMNARHASEVQAWYDKIMAWKTCTCPGCPSSDNPCGSCAKWRKEAKKLRNCAKRFAFLECYGGEENTLYETMSADRDAATGKRMFPGLQRETVHNWHEKWHEFHPWTRQWHQRCWDFEAQHGYINTLWYDKRKRYGPFDKPNAIPNMEIQGSAGSMMNKAIVEIDERIPFRGWSPFSGIDRQVHDYIGCVAPIDRAEEARTTIEEIMNVEVRGMAYTAQACVSRGWANQ